MQNQCDYIQEILKWPLDNDPMHLPEMEHSTENVFTLIYKKQKKKKFLLQK